MLKQTLAEFFFEHQIGIPLAQIILVGCARRFEGMEPSGTWVFVGLGSFALHHLSQPWRVIPRWASLEFEVDRKWRRHGHEGCCRRQRWADLARGGGAWGKLGSWGNLNCTLWKTRRNRALACGASSQPISQRAGDGEARGSPASPPLCFASACPPLHFLQLILY